MFLAGEAGVAMIGVYLFITLGNGFRYGRAYLFACQALCLFGYISPFCSWRRIGKDILPPDGA